MKPLMLLLLIALSGCISTVYKTWTSKSERNLPGSRSTNILSETPSSTDNGRPTLALILAVHPSLAQLRQRKPARSQPQNYSKNEEEDGVQNKNKSNLMELLYNADKKRHSSFEIIEDNTKQFDERPENVPKRVHQSNRSRNRAVTQIGEHERSTAVAEPDISSYTNSGKDIFTQLFQNINLIGTLKPSCPPQQTNKKKNRVEVSNAMQDMSNEIYSLKLNLINLIETELEKLTSLECACKEPSKSHLPIVDKSVSQEENESDFLDDGSLFETYQPQANIKVFMTMPPSNGTHTKARVGRSNGVRSKTSATNFNFRDMMSAANEQKTRKVGNLRRLKCQENRNCRNTCRSE